MNIRITVAYDGSRYSGWQRQGNTANTIETKFETLLSRIFGETIEINAAGRTDAGVHARGQVCNFRISDDAVKSYLSGEHCPAKTDDESLRYIMMQINRYLPNDIRVTALAKADERFHARLLATGKHYSYTVDNGDVTDVFIRKYAAAIDGMLNIALMRQAAAEFIGEHDFGAFCTKSGKRKSTVRRIDKIDINEDNGIIRFDIYGSGFLYNMVRIIVGTLIEIGECKRPADDIRRIMQTKCRAEAGFLAPPQGLCLEEVYY